MIKIYPSKLEGEPIESHSLEHETTVSQWLIDHVPGFSLDIKPRISVSVNGELVKFESWGSETIQPADDARSYVEAKDSVGDFLLGLAFPIAIPFLAGKAIRGLFSYDTPRSNTTRGSELEAANVKGSQARLNSVIREAFG